MKTKILFLMLAIVFIFTTVAYADPPGTVKNSPLFKASLKKSIEKIEGKITEDDHGTFPTVKGQVCVNTLPQPPTEGTGTCVESTCQTGCTIVETAQWTCNQSTCASTCSATCASTCSGGQPTCSNTCLHGVCENYIFRGSVWHNGQGPGQWKTDWVNMKLDPPFLFCYGKDIDIIGYGSLGGWDDQGQYYYNVSGLPVSSPVALEATAVVGYSQIQKWSASNIRFVNNPNVDPTPNFVNFMINVQP
jgi:hypothetical protein